MKVLSIDVGIKNLAYCLFEYQPSDSSFSIIKWDVISLMESEKEFCNFHPTCDAIAKFKQNDNYYCMKHSKLTVFKKPCSELSLGQIKKQTIKALYELADKYKVDYTKPIKKQELQNKIMSTTSQIFFQKITEKKASDENLIVLGTTLKRKFNLIFSDVIIDCVLIENQISPIATRMKTIQGMIAQYFIMMYDIIDVRFVSSANKLKGVSIEKLTYQERKKESIKECLKILSTPTCSTFESYFLSHTKKDDLSDCMLQRIWYLKQLN